MSNKPAFKNKYFTVWDGKFGPTVTVEKRYHDKKTDTWKSSNKFFENEMAAFCVALKEVMEHLGIEDGNKEVEAAFDDANDPTNVFNDEDIPF